MDNQQFDQFFKDALHNAEAPVPAHVWSNIVTDKAVADNLSDIKQPVSDKVWDAVEFDEIAHQKLHSWHAHVPADMWGRIANERKRRRAAAWQVSIIASIFVVLFIGLMWHKFGYTPAAPQLVHSSSPLVVDAKGSATNHAGGNISENAQKNPARYQASRNNVTSFEQAINSKIAKAATVGMENKSQAVKRFTTPSERSLQLAIQKSNESVENALLPNREPAIIEETPVFSKNNWLAPFTAAKDLNFALANDAHLRGRLFRSNITDCPSVNSRPQREWALELYAGPALGIAAHVTQPSGNDFVRRFDSATSAAVTYSAGFRVSKYLGSGLYAKAGLQLTQLAQKFAYQSENERKTVTIITVRNVVRGPGDTVRVTDTSSFVQVGYANYKSRNLVRSIDIPLTLTYNVVNNDRFQLGVTTGVIVNLQTWYQGTVFDKNMRTVHIGEEMGYKNNIGVAFIAGLHLAKPVTERWGVFAEPYFRYNMQGLTSPSSPYKQHYHQVGMQLGVKWKLNNKSSNF